MRVFKLLLIVVFSMCFCITANAYDLVVIFNSVELHTKIAGMNNVSAVTPQAKILSRGEENKNDTTYIFRGLPRDVEAMIAVVNPDNSSWTQAIVTLKDTIKIDVPLDFVPQIVNLGEVEVKADNSYITNKKAVFLPSKRDRRISSSGSSLIGHMAIPTLDVSPIDEKVTTVGGDEVSMYIDYAKASQASVENLNTNDVLRVEVYDYPDDPRFNGDRHVVNFVLVKYEYGGYTRLDGNERFILNSGKYSVYSKMSYKDMTYEVGVGDTYTNNKHTYTNSYSSFKFQDETVEYSSINDRSKNKSNDINGFLKAAYQTKKTMIDNTVGVRSNRVPGNLLEMTENFSTGNYNSGKSMSERRSNSTGVSLVGNYFFILPYDLSLMVGLTAAYSKIKSFYEYNSSGNSIINDNIDNAWNAFLPVNLTKNLGPHSFTIRLIGETMGNNMSYGGEIPANEKYRFYSGGVGVEPSFNFGSFFMRPNISLFYTSESIGGYMEKRWMPKYYLPMTYTFGNKMRIDFSSQFYFISVGASNMAPNLQSQNQIMGIKGNPNLKTTMVQSNDLSFYWKVSRCFSVVPLVQYYHSSRDINYQYEPMKINGREVMIRGIINNGVSNNWTFKLPVSFNTPNRNLTMKATPQLNLVNQNGIMGIEKNYMRFNAQFTYSFSNFYINGSYQTRAYNFSRSQHTYNKGYFTAGGGWSNGKLKVTASALCPFATYKRGYSDIITSDYISHIDNYSPAFHTTISLTASYTFSYGKKVSRGNEAQAPGGAQSGLLN